MIMEKVSVPGLMLAALIGISSVPAHAEEVTIGGDIGVYNQYVWRGLTQTSGKAAVQGDIVASYGGLSASAWFSNAYASPAPQFAGRDVVEFDWGLDYSGAIDAFGYSIGGLYYTYLYDSASNFPEAYIGLSYDALISPSATVYVNLSDSTNFTYLAGDVWVDAVLGASVAGLDLSAGASFAVWAIDAVNRATTDNFKDGIQVVTLGLSKDVPMGDVTLTASLTGSIPVVSDSVDGQKRIYGTVAENEVVFGLNLAY